MTGRSDPDPGAPVEGEDGLFDSLARAAGGELSRRQVAKLGGAVALAAIVPEWAMPGGVSPASAASRIAEASAKQTGFCPKPKAGTCPEGQSIGDWSKSCSSPVSYGFASSYNGCGPEGGVVLETVNLGDIIPDRPFGLANFFGSCKGHDCCYGTCGSDKDQCDQKFKQGNIDRCHKAWGDGSDLLNDTNLAYCLAVAHAYYQFVHRDGQDAYDAAQKSLCGCCQTCEERALADGAPAGRAAFAKACPDDDGEIRCINTCGNHWNCGTCGNECTPQDLGGGSSQRGCCWDGECTWEPGCLDYCSQTES